MIRNMLLKNPLSKIWIASIFVLIVLSPSVIFASPVFDSTNELETPPNTKFVDVAIGSSGNIYTTFIDTNLGLTIAKSIDGGQTFTETSIAACLLVDRPKIAIDPGTPDSIYVVFSCDDNTTKLVSSIDGGSNFSTTSIDSSTGSYDIAAENGQAYITLRTGSNLLFFRYNNDIVEKNVTLVSDANTFSRPEIIADNQNVSMVWTGQDNLIHFIQSTDNGDSFNPVVDISSASADGAQIHVGDSNIYIAWVNNSIIYTSTSSDGVNFSPEFEISNNLAVSSNVDVSVDSNGDAYVVWEESDGSSNRDIFVWSSSNSNVTNLSSDNSDSLNPKVSSDSNGVAFVVWSENTDSDFIEDEIFYRSTSNSGNSWQGIKDISKSPSFFGSSGISHNPEIDALNGAVAIAWEDGSGFGEESSIFVSTTSSSDLEIYLDRTQYVAGDTAQIKIIDPGNSSPSITVTVTSELDPDGITMSLAATNSNTFEGILSFTNGPSISGIIQVAPDDVITVQYTSSETQEAMSFYKQGLLSFSPFSINFDRGDISHVIVQDDFAAGSGSIVVHVSSLAKPEGIDLTLLESPPGSGVFGGSSNNQIIFMETNYLLEIFPGFTQIPIEINDSIQNTNSTTIDTVTVNVSSTSDPVGINMDLLETTNDSGIFSSLLVLSSNLTYSKIPSLYTNANDILSITYGTSTTHGLIIPQTDTTIGALLVNSSIIGDDTITVDYNGNIITATVGDFVVGGGGGGGFAKAGLVVQAIGAVNLLRAGVADAPPTLGLDQNQKRIVSGGFSFNDNPINVLQYYTPYPLITTPVGQNNTIKLKIYEERGLDNIAHVGLSYGLGKGEIFNEGRATIEYDVTFDGIGSVTLFDPEHVLGSVNVTTSDVRCGDNTNAVCREFTFHHVFREPLEYNMVATNIWDFERNGWQNFFNHGIHITGTSMNTPNEYDGINKGIIYHLTQTGKRTAVDALGNSWSLDYGVWSMDYKPVVRNDADIINDEKAWAIEHVLGDKTPADMYSLFGYDRNHSKFASVKDGQSMTAQSVMKDICLECTDESYDKINNIFSHAMPTPSYYKLDDPETVTLMKLEDQKARQFLQTFFEKIYHKSVD